MNNQALTFELTFTLELISSKVIKTFSLPIHTLICIYNCNKTFRNNHFGLNLVKSIRINNNHRLNRIYSSLALTHFPTINAEYNQT
jgi:hypothetical protein